MPADSLELARSERLTSTIERCYSTWIREPAITGRAAKKKSEKNGLVGRIRVVTRKRRRRGRSLNVMANAAFRPVLQQVERIFGPGTVIGLTDDQLLERFAARRDEVAFEALLARHGPMVLGICRRLLRDPHAAEDAFQATFLVLVRKSSVLRRPDRLSPWLHGVAYRVAVRARALAAERRWREQPGLEGLAGRADPAGAIGSDELGSILDEELRRLPEKFRAPIVLCHLEGQTHEQAAERLSLPVGTVRSRLARGRERLRGRLARRGLAPAMATVSAALATESARAAVPGVLLDATVQAAVRFAMKRASSASEISAAVAALTEGAVKAMLLHKVRIAACVILAACAIAAGVAVFDQKNGAAGSPVQAARSRSDQAEKPEGDAPIPFKKVALATDDLLEVTNLDIYKFQVDLKNGERFRVVLRALESKGKPARELVSFDFQKTGDRAATIRVSFLRSDRKLEGFLLSNAKQAEYRLSCSGCDPSGFVTYVQNPLGNLDPTRRGLIIHESEIANKRVGIDETRLISLVATEPGPLSASSYPRAELVIIEKQLE
jgi:RNA polymerase sigma factor (sigma-70 family)